MWSGGVVAADEWDTVMGRYLLLVGQFAQMTPYYLPMGSVILEVQQLRNSSLVYVAHVTADSLIISPESETLKHCSIYKRNQEDTGGVLAVDLIFAGAGAYRA